MGAGRPNTYNFEMCKEICSEVANGFNIKAVLSSKDEYPTFQTWCNWKRENPELFDLYVKAMQDKAESEMEEIDHVYSELKAGNLEASVANVLIQTNKWKASKFYPKMFGDKVDHTTNGKEIQPSTVINLSGLSTETLKDLEQNIKE